MGIWTYSDSSRSPEESLRSMVYAAQCCYCGTRLRNLHSDRRPEVRDVPHQTFQRWINVCDLCGWWTVLGEWNAYDEYEGRSGRRAAAGTLRELDLTDLRLPVAEVRNYLLAKYDSRYDLHPRLFEDVVGAVFGDFGFEPTVTAYSKDGGLDVILQDADHAVGIQVKRYRNSIEVEQIRSLAGALLLRGLTEGIFVTTSSFQSGAAATARQYNELGYRIELVGAVEFYDALKIRRGDVIASKEEFESRFGSVNLRDI